MKIILGYYKNDILVSNFWNSSNVRIYKKYKLLERLLINPNIVNIINDDIAITLKHENKYNPFPQPYLSIDLANDL